MNKKMNHMKAFLNIEKLKKYLLKTNIDKSKQSSKENNNVIGTILSYSTKLQFNENLKRYDLLSILLFLDFRTGRVERYLINNSDPNANKKSIDYKEDLYFSWNNVKYKIFLDMEHSTHEKITLSDMDPIGKINSKFYITFMMELLSDYLFYFPRASFNDGNIASLRKLTLARKPAKYEFDKDESLSNSEYIPKITEPGLGTGVMPNVITNSITESNEYKLKDFQVFESKIFVNGNIKPKKQVIFVPKQYKNRMIEIWFEKLNYKLVYTNKNELSQIVKDFTRTLSIKTVKTNPSVTQRIKLFNYHSVRSLTDLQENTNHFL